MTEITLTIADPVGLHARPAAQFVRQAASYACRVTVAARGRAADAKSLLALLGLGLNCGTEITLTADGPDEQQCIAALAALLRGDDGPGRHAQ